MSCCERLQSFSITSSYPTEPFPIKLRDPALSSPPTAWTVIEPQFTESRTCAHVLVATQDGTIHVISPDEPQNMLLSNGPFTRLAVSPKGGYLACFNAKGVVWIVTLDFAHSQTNYDTGTGGDVAPQQFLWCGEDAVAFHWADEGDPTVFVLPRRPTSDSSSSSSLSNDPSSSGGSVSSSSSSSSALKPLRFEYDDPVYLVSEVDGLRIISETHCEFLEKVQTLGDFHVVVSYGLRLFEYLMCFRLIAGPHSLTLLCTTNQVPDATVSIFRIGSKSPEALLAFAAAELAKQSPKADDILRLILPHLPTAVEARFMSSSASFS